jgi:hypothetical protein
LAAAQGQIKPRAAHTFACLRQTLLESVYLGRDGYINAFGTGSANALS